MLPKFKTFKQHIQMRKTSTVLGSFLLLYSVFFAIVPVVYFLGSASAVNAASRDVYDRLSLAASSAMLAAVEDGTVSTRESQALSALPGVVTIMRGDAVLFSSSSSVDGGAACSADDLANSWKGFDLYYRYLPPRNGSAQNIIILSACYVALLAAMYLSIFTGLYRPILKIERVLNGAVHGDTDFDFSKGQNSPVLSTIFADLTLLINNMKTLVLKESTAQLMKKQAELDALQNQINPHFLYNTLDSIRGQASEHGLHDVEMMALSLSQLFRYSISNHDTFIALKEELLNIDNYLLIQNIRFDGKFNKISRVDEDTLLYKIPKLLIQPLVENAVYHGLEPKLNHGTITISVYKTHTRLIVSIKDDGLGLPNEKLIEINDMLQKNAPITDSGAEGAKKHVGLSNVNSRIRLLFGDEYGLTLFSTVNVGTEVQITLPLIS